VIPSSLDTFSRRCRPEPTTGRRFDGDSDRPESLGHEGCGCARYAGLVREFIADIEARSVVTPAIAARAESLVSRCAPALGGGVTETVHTDLTFANALWDGTKMWLIDLEFCCTAPIDDELTWICRYCWYEPGSIPPEWEETVTAADHSVIPGLLRNHYPELFHVEALKRRLTMYGLASFARGWLIRPDTTAARLITKV
jgi:hypothetical protein